MFKERVIEDIKEAEENGQFKTLDFNPPHAEADPETALKLYGINRWANENNIDLIIHIHFNDYPRKYSWARGDYKGFAVYFPEAALSNSPQSFRLASFVFQRLIKNWPVSTYPPESLGMVPEQKLIAIGANNSLDRAAVILIEYGYIYEQKFNTFWKRDTELHKMAKETYQGIKNYAAFISRLRS